MITQKLIALADAPYRDFTAGLIPTVDKARIIGVRPRRNTCLCTKMVGKHRHLHSALWYRDITI